MPRVPNPSERFVRHFSSQVPCASNQYVLDTLPSYNPTHMNVAHHLRYILRTLYRLNDTLNHSYEIFITLVKVHVNLDIFYLL